MEGVLLTTTWFNSLNAQFSKFALNIIKDIQAYLIRSFFSFVKSKELETTGLQKDLLLAH